jgi:hypothetical protein
MRKIVVLLCLLLGACADKYPAPERASGPWIPANVDPLSRSNNIMPVDEGARL